MYKKKKGVSKKVVFAIVLVALIVVGAAYAAVFSSQKQQKQSKANVVGVKVGDFFTYDLSGQANGPVPSTISSDFSIYNDTAFYNVTVTAINGTVVTLDTDWVLQNGTSIDTPQTVDVASGILSDQNGFYALYPADMYINETVYPHVYQGVWVNGTDPTTYSSGTRNTDYYTATGLLYYSQDPTHSTQCSTYDQINFDKQTGMLTDLVSIRDYNNPVVSTEIIWSLTDTNAWVY